MPRFALPSGFRKGLRLARRISSLLPRIMIAGSDRRRAASRAIKVLLRKQAIAKAKMTRLECVRTVLWRQRGIRFAKPQVNVLMVAKPHRLAGYLEKRCTLIAPFWLQGMPLRVKTLRLERLARILHSMMPYYCKDRVGRRCGLRSGPEDASFKRSNPHRRKDSA